jgi:hypothetical protein
MIGLDNNSSTLRKAKARPGDSTHTNTPTKQPQSLQSTTQPTSNSATRQTPPWGHHHHHPPHPPPLLEKWGSTVPTPPRSGPCSHGCFAGSPPIS